MHDGCTGGFANGKQVVNKLRQMGFSGGVLPQVVEVACVVCNNPFQMKTYESRCPSCGLVYGVTPCHAHDPASIQPAGIDY